MTLACSAAPSGISGRSKVHIAPKSSTTIWGNLILMYVCKYFLVSCAALGYSFNMVFENKRASKSPVQISQVYAGFTYVGQGIQFGNIENFCRPSNRGRSKHRFVHELAIPRKRFELSCAMRPGLPQLQGNLISHLNQRWDRGSTFLWFAF